MRESTEAKVLSAGNQLARMLVGMLIFATGAYFEAQEYQEPPPVHTTHVVIWACAMAFGLLVAFSAYLFPVLQKVIVIAGPYIPGGRRATDPPADIELPPPESKP